MDPDSLDSKHLNFIDIDLLDSQHLNSTRFIACKTLIDPYPLDPKHLHSRSGSIGAAALKIHGYISIRFTTLKLHESGFTGSTINLKLNESGSIVSTTLELN